MYHIVQILFQYFLIRSQIFDKEPEYLTSIDSCNIHENTKCNEFPKWMDKDLLWGWNRRLVDAFQFVLKKVRVPGMFSKQQLLRKTKVTGLTLFLREEIHLIVICKINCVLTVKIVNHVHH